LLPCISVEKYIYILALEMASPGNQRCAGCIGTLSFPIRSLRCELQVFYTMSYFPYWTLGRGTYKTQGQNDSPGGSTRPSTDFDVCDCLVESRPAGVTNGCRPLLTIMLISRPRTARVLLPDSYLNVARIRFRANYIHYKLTRHE